MRTRHVLRSGVSAVAMAAVLVLGTSTAFASSFLSWEGPQNTGRAKEITPCGCSNIDPNFRAAYRFTHTGQDATMYNAPTARECGTTPSPGAAKPPSRSAGGASLSTADPTPLTDQPRTRNGPAPPSGTGPRHCAGRRGARGQPADRRLTGSSHRCGAVVVVPAGLCGGWVASPP